MNLKNKTLLELGAALGLLDNNTLIEPKLVYYLARTIRKIEPYVHALDKARQSLLDNLQGEEDKEKIKGLREQWETLLETEVTLDVEPRLSVASLRLYDPILKEGNKIGPKMLAALEPIMIQEDQ